MHLECPHDADPIVGMQTGRHGRVDLGQAGVRVAQCLQLGPECRIAGGQHRQWPDERGQPEGCPAHDDDVVGAGPGLVHGRQEVGHVEILVGLTHVHGAVGEAGPDLGWRLGRSDVHAPVDSHGVGTDEGGTPPLSQLQRQIGLARARRTAQQQHSHDLTPDGIDQLAHLELDKVLGHGATGAPLDAVADLVAQPVQRQSPA